MARSTALIDTCDGCGAPDGLFVARFHEHNCPRCSEKRDTYNMAQLHLETLIGPILKAWREHYTARGLGELELDEVLELVGKQSGNTVQWTPDSNPKADAAIIHDVLQQAA